MKTVLSMVLLVPLAAWLSADEIIPGNDDLIGGKDVTDNDEEAAETEEKPNPLEGEISAGFNQSTGNTENVEFSLSFDANRETSNNEFRIKGDGYYSSSEGEMDAQKWYTMARYARRIWNDKWVNFYKFEADHDKFSGVDYRLLPSVGVGYLLRDTPEFRVMVDGAIGLEKTTYNDGTEDTDEAVFIGTISFEKTFSGRLKASHETSLYSYLDESDEYRIHSESSLTNPIANGLSMRLGLIVDYDSNPSEDRENTDTRLMTSIVYGF
jgi:putative salt-induced outer membrane protein YdiY